MYSEKRIKKYFNKAKEMSHNSIEHNKVGAILVYKNKIIGIGYNRNVSSPIQKKYNIYRTNETRVYNVETMNNYIHAEIDCVERTKRLCNIDLNKCSLFIYRETKSGSMGLSKPCSACSMYLKDNNISNIYYTNDFNGYTYERRIYD